MIWNQVQDLKSLKVYDVKKNCGGITSFLQRPLVCDCFSCFVLHDAPIDIRHLSYCLSFPRATSAISLSSLEEIREQSGSLSPTIQQHWQGDAAILWYWEHPWYAKSMNFKHEKPSAPQIGDSISGPASHHFEAPGHRCPWRPPRRLWRAKAPQPRPGRSLPPSAAASSLRRLSRGRRPRGRSRGDDEGWTKLSSVPFNRQTNDECFWTQRLQICSKQKITNTLNKFQYILFPTNYLQRNDVHKYCLFYPPCRSPGMLYIAFHKNIGFIKWKSNIFFNKMLNQHGI